MVDKLGAGDYESMHVIDNTSEMSGPHVADAEYRIYHSSGYCFDIKSKLVKDGGNPTIQYTFFAEWDGFNKITLSQAVRLVNKYL